MAPPRSAAHTRSLMHELIDKIEEADDPNRRAQLAAALHVLTTEMAEHIGLPARNTYTPPSSPSLPPSRRRRR